VLLLGNLAFRFASSPLFLFHCARQNIIMSQSGPYEFTPPTIQELEKLLPGYAFEGLIAKGGMGAVYKARQRSLERDVAVKILPRELGADPQFRKSFETEARAMARLNHANLIGVYDSGDVDSMPFIVMEYVPGKSLYHSAYGKKIESGEAVRIVLGILAGLGHAHEHSIIHRDIKPANILLTPKAEPKIGDFGLAVPTGAAHTGLVMGTPGYTAPEVIKNPSAADARSDLFAVGVILYELLTGELPGDSTKPPSALCDCPASFDSVLLRAIHPNPTFRFQNCTAMASALETAAKSAAAPTKPAAAALRTATAKPAAALVTGAAPSGKTEAKPTPPGDAKPADDKSSVPPPDAASESPPAPGTSPAVSSLPKIQMESGSNWGLIRNVLIVAAVIILGAVAWKAIERSSESGKTETRKEKKSEWAEKYAKQAESAAPATPSSPAAKTPGEKTSPGKTGTAAAAKPPKPEPKPETPLQALERLRRALVAGQRKEMPPGTARHGDFDMLLVSEPMGWDQAVSFAEQYGGHLAVPTSNEDLTWLSERIGKGSIWVGAGRNAAGKWLMLDGSLWQPELKARGRGAYAALSYLGLVRGTPGNTPLPFFIQWRRDGANPVLFDSLLLKTRMSLDLPDPLFPPGSVPCKARRFLLVERPATWAEARNIAECAGGSLAIISDTEEALWLEDFLAARKPSNGVWIGGTLKGGSWKWIDGEPFGTPRWADGQPDQSLKRAAILAGPDGKWTASDPKEKAGGFVIEWSDDGATSVQKAAEFGRIAGGLAPLRKKAAELVAKADADHKTALAANARCFRWSLDVWLRELPEKDRPAWKIHTDNLKEKIAGTRVPEQVASSKTLKISDRMAKIVSFSAEQQKKIDEDYTSKLARIREVYLQRLSKLLAVAQQAGKYDLAREIKKSMVEAKGDAAALPAVFGIGS
jgi:serine/threonine protein kinase